MRYRYAFLSLMAFMLAFSMLVFSAVAYADDNDPGHSGGSNSHFDKDKSHHGDQDRRGDQDHHGDQDNDDCDGGGNGGGGNGSSGGSGGGSDTTVNGGGLYIVQGAPGRDLSSTFYPTYPIDVLVNESACLVQNAPFPSVQGAFLENTGTHDLKISPANAAAPCTNPYVRDVHAAVVAGKATFVVVALDMQSKLTTYTFNLPLPRVQMGTAGVVIADAADAPAMDPGTVPAPLPGTASMGGSMSLSGGGAPSSFTSLTTIAPGQSISLVLPAGPFTGNIYYAGTNQVALGPFNDILQSRSIEVYFLVGASQTGSLQIVSARIPAVF